jgi:nucleolar protein 56
MNKIKNMDQKREEFFKRVKKKVKEAISSKDNLLLQTVGAIEELDKASNLLFERLSEWYGMYFPELKLSDNEKFVRAVKILDRKNIDENKIREVFPQNYYEIIQKAQNSLGSDLSEQDLEIIKNFASQVENLWKTKKQIEEYQAQIAKEICPNLTFLLGSSLAAKLVAKARGLKRLSTLPSSTIQVLGAEKALFKHLKTGSKPPKHGIIFQHPLISSSPKKIRGKIARALSAKLAIASKADAISHNFIADKLKKRFEQQAEKIIEKYKKGVK